MVFLKVIEVDEENSLDEAQITEFLFETSTQIVLKSFFPTLLQIFNQRKKMRKLIQIYEELESPNTKEEAKKVILETKNFLSKNQVQHKVIMNLENIQKQLEKIESIFQKELPSLWNHFLELEKENDFYLNEEMSSLWWAKKSLSLDSTLSNYIGKNESTTINIFLSPNKQMINPNFSTKPNPTKNLLSVSKVI